MEQKISSVPFDKFLGGLNEKKNSRVVYKNKAKIMSAIFFIILIIIISIIINLLALRERTNTETENKTNTQADINLFANVTQYI